VAERLQKLLAAAGLASRREAERWIRAGRVTVNGRVATLGESAEAKDDVRVDGNPVRRERLEYWLLHKPRGVITTRSDPHAAEMGRKTVLELLPAAAREVRLFPVGRLDVDSEGLLLLTNDGAVAQALTHPSLGCEKVYRVTVRGQLRPDEAGRLARGLVLEDGPMAPCRVGPRQFDPRTRRTTFELTLREGRKRQIRRALAQLLHPVVRLVRERMGPLELGDLARGRSRRLARGEVDQLRRFSRERKPQARGAGNPRTRG